MCFISPRDHRSIIKYLTDKGYLVLLTGDRVFDQRYACEFDHRLICGQWLDVDVRLFSLFTHTECDIWIGQQAGPCVLPVINHIPMLMVDAFPFGNGFPNAWMHYKTVRDDDGNLVHYDRLFADHAYEYGVSGLCDNSPQEILAAVKEFLQNGEDPVAIDASQRVLASLPDHVQTKHVNCRLSPAWLRLFDETNPGEHSAMAAEPVNRIE